MRGAWQVEPGLPPLRTDALKRTVVVKNLLVEALEFTDRGRVTVRAAARDGGDAISVADPGSGFGAAASAAAPFVAS